MEDLLEILVPVIFILLAGVGKLLESRQEKKASQQPEDPQEAERRRRIQEEIRRRILERRSDTPAPSSDNAPEREYDPTLPDYMQRRQAPAEPSQPQLRQPIPEPPEEPAFDAPQQRPYRPAWEPVEEPLRDFQAELAEQIRAMQEAQQAAAQVRQNTGNVLAESEVGSGGAEIGVSAPAVAPTRPTNYGAGRISREIRETLRDPQATRKAILFYEILGTPVGLRENGSLKPSWQT